MSLQFLDMQKQDINSTTYSLLTETNQSILSPYNGRVNIVEPEDPNARFKMFEKTNIKNKSIDYRNALENVWEDNVLAQVFFLPQNMQIIQDSIKIQVYQMSGNKYVLPNQNVDQLKIIMRSIYLQYATHSTSISITKQVEDLNNLVLDYAVPYCYNESVSYEKYIQDQSTLVVPLERELQPDRRYNQLELKPFM